MLILLLAAVPFAWGQINNDFEQRLRAGLKELAPNLEIDFARLEVMDDGAGIVINNVVISEIAPSPPAQGKPPAKPLAAAKTTIERVEIINPNFNAFLSSAPSSLADQIKLEEMHIESSSGAETSVKMTLLTKPSAPWPDIYSLKNKNQAELLAWLGSQVRIGSVEKSGIVMLSGGEIVSIDKITTANCTLFNVPDATVSGLAVKSTVDDGSELSLAQIKFSYDFSAPFKAWLAGGAGEEGFSNYFMTNKFEYKFALNEFKAYMRAEDAANNPIVSVKNMSFAVTANLPSDSSYSGSIDNLKIANHIVDEAVQSMSGSSADLLLKGKPLELSLKSDGRMALGKFQPSGFSLTAPNLADFKLNISARFTPEYMDSIANRFSGVMDDNDLDDLMNSLIELYWNSSMNILVEKISLDYQDKGLINGIFATLGGGENGIKDIRTSALAQIDNMLKQYSPNESKFIYEFMKNFRTLLQKPGTMSITLTPTPPALAKDIGEQLENNGPIKYTIRVK
jgi:hypothetical protein